MDKYKDVLHIVYSSMWLFTAVCGCLQQYVVVYSSMWLFTAVCGCLQQYVVVYSSMWLFSCFGAANYTVSLSWFSILSRRNLVRKMSLH